MMQEKKVSDLYQAYQACTFQMHMYVGILPTNAAHLCFLVITRQQNNNIQISTLEPLNPHISDIVNQLHEQSAVGKLKIRKTVYLIKV